jgi:pre-mRNA-splicing factor CWC22
MSRSITPPRRAVHRDSRSPSRSGGKRRRVDSESMSPLPKRGRRYS